MAAKRDQRLVANAQRKRRTPLLPSDADMKFLGEAATLAETENVVMVTNDCDFTSFKSEIRTTFGVRILDIQQLPEDATSIERILAQI